jgi:battenin
MDLEQSSDFGLTDTAPSGSQPSTAPLSISARIAMTLLGVINNIFFLIVSSSSQRIVLHYKASGNIGVVYSASTICSLFASSVNAWLSTKGISYDWRFFLNTVFMGLGLLGCATAPTFWLACVAIVFVGFPCDFGESVALGYLAYTKREPLVKFWSIGTGAAGILGSGYSILCIALEDRFDYRVSFYALLPLVLVYALSYFLMLRVSGSQFAPLNSDALLSDNPKQTEKDSKGYWNLDFLKQISYYFFTCDVVYFAQYVIASAFLDCAETDEVRRKYKFMFALLGLCQHIGVMLLTSSRNLFRCPWLITMAVVQCINFVIWLSQSMLHWMPIWSQFIFIFVVGATGGLSYVNTYDMVLTDERLSAKHRELGANFTSWSVLVAVLLSSLFCYVAEQTFLKPFIPIDPE